MTRLSEDRQFAENYFAFLSDTVSVAAAENAARCFGKHEVPEPAQQRELLAAFDHGKGHFVHLAALSAMQLSSLKSATPLLHAGFNILLYGYGSKVQLLKSYVSSEEIREAFAVVEVTGFDEVALCLGPLMVLASMLNALSRCLADGDMDDSSLPNTKSGILQRTDLLITRLAKAQAPVLLTIHQLDAPVFRHVLLFEVLERILCQCPGKLSIIATLDNPNIGNLMSCMQFERFNWVWSDATTLQPYGAELGRFAVDSCAAAASRQSPRAAVIVLQSLTSNSRSIFKLLATYQLSLPEAEIAEFLERDASNTNAGGESDDDETAAGTASTKHTGIGMPYHALFQKCQENFVVTVEANFRTQLTEFTDHDLFKSFEGFDSSVRFFIPFLHSELRQILENI